jgi:hypothetical protein
MLILFLYRFDTGPGRDLSSLQFDPPCLVRIQEALDVLLFIFFPAMNNFRSLYRSPSADNQRISAS